MTNLAQTKQSILAYNILNVGTVDFLTKWEIPDDLLLYTL